MSAADMAYYFTRDTKLSSSLASLDKIPAQVTVPIACGAIEKVS
jgi:hypothetical protein